MVEAEKDFNEFMDKAINKLEDDDYVGQTRTVIKILQVIIQQMLYLPQQDKLMILCHKFPLLML